jgi:protein-disulfide isomerase
MEMTSIVKNHSWECNKEKREKPDGRWSQVNRSGRWFLVGSLFFTLFLVFGPFFAQTSKAEILAEVNGEAITAEELRKILGLKLTKLEEQIYALKRQQLDRLIEERLLEQKAERRGISVVALLDEEVTAKVKLVTEAEIEGFYQENKSRFSGDKTVIREKIRSLLQQKKLDAHKQLYVYALRSKAKIQDNLQPPPVFRYEVATDGAPVRGVAEAPVTLVEFSDFHCPFCKRVQPILEQLLVKYPKRVKLVFQDFPLDKLHPQARGAAEAARCAHEQGKFWEYHDLLFANAPKASSGDLETYAEQAGLEVKTFQSCLSDGGQQTAVQQDVREGARLGITGTPMFFINGRPLSGALPLERFIQVIEEELAHLAVAQKNADPKS